MDATQSYASPFSAALRDYPHLPPAFRAQFLLSPDDDAAVVFEGRMDRVWRRHSWLWPLFWLLTRANMLFPETGQGVPATMTIVPGRDERGLPQQRWQRTFSFARVRRFDAVMGVDPARGRVIERFGGAGWLEVGWQVTFRPPDTMEITTCDVAVRLGRRRFGLPRFLAVAVRAVERADRERDDAITIDLRLMLPLLGPVFGYSGSFRLRRVAYPGEGEAMKAHSTTPNAPDAAYARYRPWFYAAAAYNLLWGAIVLLWPRRTMRLLRLPEAAPTPLWQVIGMFVLVYAPGYWWVARRPERHRQLVVIGLLGKVLGPLGFLWSLRRGTLPRAFGWTLLTNDLLWWPAFCGYLRLAARRAGGWAALLRGD